jgi:hypothetical protein
MTILDVLTTPDRVGIITDSAVVLEGRCIGWASKVLALPSARALVGGGGGHFLLGVMQSRLLDALPVGADAGTVAEIASECLRTSAPHFENSSATTVIVAGIFGDELGAVMLRGPLFAPEPLRHGILLGPGLSAHEVAPRPVSTPIKPEPAAVAPEPAAPPPRLPWRHSWEVTLELGLRFVDRQREERRVATGGPLKLATIAHDGGIELRQLAVLPFLEAAP